LTDRVITKWSGRRGSNSQLSAWEFTLGALYFQSDTCRTASD